MLENNEEVIEEHNLIFDMLIPHGDVYITGLPRNRTMYQVKQRAAYAFEDNEAVTLNCTTKRKGLLRWKVDDETVSQAYTDMTISKSFILTKEYNGKRIICLDTARNIYADVKFYLNPLDRSHAKKSRADKLQSQAVNVKITYEIQNNTKCSPYLTEILTAKLLKSYANEAPKGVVCIYRGDKITVNCSTFETSFISLTQDFGNMRLTATRNQERVLSTDLTQSLIFLESNNDSPLIIHCEATANGRMAQSQKIALLLVEEDNARKPSMTIQLFESEGRCESLSKLIVPHMRPFIMNIFQDTEEVLNLVRCYPSYSGYDRYHIETNDIKKRKYGRTVAQFPYIHEQFDEFWECAFITASGRVTCNLPIHVRKPSMSVTINGKAIVLPTNGANELEWDAEGNCTFERGEALNVRMANFLQLNVTLLRNNQVIFQKEVKSGFQFMVNTRFFSGPVWLHLTSKMEYGTSKKIRLQLIPVSKPSDIKIELSVEGLPLTPFKKGNSTYKYYYVYVYTRNVYVCCKKIFSNSMALDLIEELGKKSMGIKRTDEDKLTSYITLNEYLKGYKARCSLINNQTIVEEHEIEFVYEPAHEIIFISGLPQNQTLYQIDSHAQYIYEVNERLTLNCSTWCWFRNSSYPLQWRIGDEAISEGISVGYIRNLCSIAYSFLLTEDLDGKYITCFRSPSNSTADVKLIKNRGKSSSPYEGIISP